MKAAKDPFGTVVARALTPGRVPPRTIPRRDFGFAAALLVAQTVIALNMPESDGRTPDLLGWTLLSASALVVVFRTRAPWLTTAAVMALIGPYHAQDFAHTAATPVALFVLFCLAVTGPALRTFLTLGAVLGAMGTALAILGRGEAVAGMVGGSGWLFAFALIGEAVRLHRNYVSAIVERAERAERTREEEAARRVAEERLRIARDLHDLLAHSITLIGVQTSVAAHLLVADPERLDPQAVARSLDGIADTCREARSELRTTLAVLREDETSRELANGAGPLPGLSGVPDLVRAAESAGARVRLQQLVGAVGQIPAAVGAAAYRIVQESLTNAVRHAGPAVGISVVLECTSDGDALQVAVHDDGGPAARQVPAAPDGPSGYGIVGMRERARSVGGALHAAPRSDGPGFRVTAVLPLPSAV